MAVAITIVILGLYAIWAFRRSDGAGAGKGSSSRPGNPKKKKKSCKWEKTGETKGRFIEYQCKTCSVIALSHTGTAPQDCKSDLGGTKFN